MSDIVKASAAQAIALPKPKMEISVRAGTLEDLSFIDGLQKKHTHMVGWMPTAQLEGKIKLGHVLVAENVSRERVGYVIGNDQYFKRDDLGIIYQVNVAPVQQRGLIGATLVKALFDRAAYGCKLFCCWCAQDIEANRFWESLGFVPLAFRAGSRGKKRVHIFWQRRIRQGDTTTPYWFPSQTSSGSIREDRLVLPIPPGTHWSDAKPIVLPGMEQTKQLEEKAPRQPRAPRVKAVPVKNKLAMARHAFHFAPPKPAKGEKAVKTKEPKPKVKNDPAHVAAARELRDRYLEAVESGAYLPQGNGKYEVARQLQAAAEPMMGAKLLSVAA